MYSIIYVLVSHDQPGLLESYEVKQVWKRQEAVKHENW